MEEFCVALEKSLELLSLTRNVAKSVLTAGSCSPPRLKYCRRLDNDDSKSRRQKAQASRLTTRPERRSACEGSQVLLCFPTQLHTGLAQHNCTFCSKLVLARIFVWHIRGQAVIRFTVGRACGMAQEVPVKVLYGGMHTVMNELVKADRDQQLCGKLVFGTFVTGAHFCQELLPIL